MTLPHAWHQRLRLPAVAAPMTDVSGPDLVIAAAVNGIIGTFPTHNAKSADELEEWLSRITAATGPAGSAQAAPVGANLVVHRSNTRLASDLDSLLRHRLEIVITSVGSPAAVVGPLHDAGILVLADVASIRHAHKAIEAGVDGLVLLSAGAGGQTGWANPLSFVRALRDDYDGILVLAGGISDGYGVLAARAAGADLAYLGTRFIATTESLASDAYRQAVVAATLDDIAASVQVSGLPANVLRSWLEAQDITPTPPAGGAGDASPGFAQDRLLAQQNVWAAGHSVSGIDEVLDIPKLAERLAREYQQAQDLLLPAAANGISRRWR
ncbi:MULTISPECIES: NAD(P)H-dependent flavin oxidoreductase [Protofrankia]|uniref:2-nitropropane dioxygenase NPD n=1 Tax=Candidatus Protofrankia datiscae TaxID=2716812 RepID=F8AY64_9ACTN|nr:MULTISPECIES: nitronate monooxygenase [Protofrankia]AEH09494.1 2-nitropropane dioxygenase NPD [Candidatus Protofrankia datiscae]